MSTGLAEHLRKKGETARTVTTKVRYPDFAIRSRSTSLPVGTDDPTGSASSRASSSTVRSTTGPAAPARRRRRLGIRASPTARLV